MLKGVFVDTGVCVIAPLTNAAFAFVEDTNGNATDGATPVPERKKLYCNECKYDHDIVLHTRTSIY